MNNRGPLNRGSTWVFSLCMRANVVYNYECFECNCSTRTRASIVNGLLWWEKPGNIQCDCHDEKQWKQFYVAYISYRFEGLPYAIHVYTLKVIKRVCKDPM